MPTSEPIFVKARRLGILTICLIGGLAAILAGLSGIQYLKNDRPIVLPVPQGPNRVGRIDLLWTDPKRGYPMATVVWYPSLEEVSGGRARYLPAGAAEPTAGSVFPIPLRRYVAIEGHSTERASLLPGKFPLIVLSPGMGRIPTDYTTIAEHLASFGYLVAGVTPTATARLDLRRREQEQPLVNRWVEDFRSTLNRLEGGDDFRSRIQWDRVGILGHSFGGAAALQALKSEPRFKRAVNLDGASQGALVTGLQRPALIILGGTMPVSDTGLDAQIVQDLRAICRMSRASCEIENRPGAAHMNFSDAGVLPSRFPIPRSRLELGEVDGLAFLHGLTRELNAYFSHM